MTTSRAGQFAGWNAANGSPRVLVMRPEIKAYNLTAGGLLVFQAELSKAAEQNLQNAAAIFARDRGLTFVFATAYGPPTSVEEKYTRLFATVASTIEENYFRQKLPHKGKAFDWSLGPGIAPLRERFGTEYALFVTYRGYRTSIERKMVTVARSAAGMAVGFFLLPVDQNSSGLAVLVDLNTGAIIWANRLIQEWGELDEADDAGAVINHLLKGFPAVTP